MVKIVCIFLALCSSDAFAETMGVVQADSVNYRKFSEADWSVHKSLKKILDGYDSAPRHHEKKIYPFNNSKIGEHFLCGSKDSGHWVLRDENDNQVGWFYLAIFPNCREAMKMALSKRQFSQVSSLTSDNTFIERENDTTFLSYRLGTEQDHQVSIHTAMRDGVLLIHATWTNQELKRDLTRQKTFMNKIIDVVLSNCPHKDYSDELNAIRKRNAEQRRLRDDPCFRMPVHLRIMHCDDVLIKETLSASKQFVHPQKMWDRPSWEWFDQFKGKKKMKKSDHIWNKYAGELCIQFPAQGKKGDYECKIFVAHAISKYEALRFLEGMFLDGIPFEREQYIKHIERYLLHPNLAGEYDLAVKPQLDDSGALIPNSDESDICFVRNNTAVRVVADRPDVSVLWIAKKIDEELIAAGKGEPPTWSPPRKRTPASAVRQQPIAVPSKQH